MNRHQQEAPAARASLRRSTTRAIRKSLAPRSLLWWGCLALAIGCRGREEPETASLRAKVVEAERAVAQKDSLLNEFVETSQFIQNLNGELERIRKLPGTARIVIASDGETRIPVKAYRDSVLAHVRQLISRLDSSEARLAAVSGRTGSTNNVLSRQVAAMQAMLSAVRERFDGQQAELASLQGENRQLQSDRAGLRAERERLDRESAALKERLADAAEAEGTVYFIAGTKAQLLEIGAVREEGGARSLSFRKRGQTLVPGRELHPDDFTPISRMGNRDLRMPKESKAYLIVSQHNPALLTPTDKNMAVRGTVHIEDPIAFWAPSRFLILVEQP